jgi:hypothetical protein
MHVEGKWDGIHSISIKQSGNHILSQAAIKAAFSMPWVTCPQKPSAAKVS